MILIEQKVLPTKGVKRYLLKKKQLEKYFFPTGFLKKSSWAYFWRHQKQDYFF